MCKAFRAVLVLTLILGGCEMAHPQEHWTASWGASQQVPEPGNALAPADLNDGTLREVVHLSAGGDAIRVRLSNAFGTSALHITGVHVARPLSTASDAIDPATDHALTFVGAADVTIPPGADYWSDPVSMPVGADADLAITLHLDTAPAQQTSHPGSRSTAYLIHGAHLSDARLTGATKMEHWFFLSGVDVASRAAGSCIVALGDSITDGHGATTNGNDRWPDDLARRLEADKRLRGTGVVNAGIGGNHLLTDGLGPNALARFDRDVLAQSGVRVLIVLEGINDLGAYALEPVRPTPAMYRAHVHDLEASFEQIVARAHAQGIYVVGATILPFVGSDYYHPGPADEAARQELNAWIRTPGHFDAVVDFDHVTADPTAPDRLLPAYDSGDHLHPSVAGYHAMADAFPLSLLEGR